MKRNTVLTIVGAVAVTACASHAPASSSQSSAASTVARVGQLAPSWTEPAVPDGTVSMAALRGKAVYLNFFATWCPPCNEEAPTLESLQRQYASRGFVVVGVDVLENARKAEEFRSRHHLSYTAIVDDGTLRNQYNINGLPVHVFIDRSGVVRTIEVGEISASDMRADVLKLLR
ncbi:MAG: TlpA family protein disulfide reductase [Candidatus Eremiobacteraeota bacterium]|nr:TlpA family protein disulfide reductase [Candidatus Eremiobacteraeota bacterium]MBV8432754.1 TlpA family protein disulfide reductase [Candidatus Eremiobacteraeota bacterium]